MLKSFSSETVLTTQTSSLAKKKSKCPLVWRGNKITLDTPIEEGIVGGRAKLREKEAFAGKPYKYDGTVWSHFQLIWLSVGGGKARRVASASALPRVTFNFSFYLVPAGRRLRTGRRCVQRKSLIQQYCLVPRLHLLFQDRFSFWPGGFSPRVGSQARGKFLFDWLFPDVIVCACVCVLHPKWPLNRCGKNCCALLSLEWTTSHPRREGRFHANTVSEEGFGLLCYCEVVWGKGDFSISLLWNFDSTLLTKP